jgi:AcrR family transcriptional regulator
MARFTQTQREALTSAMQDEVFRVATEILREGGIGALTMERIAQQAGVSRGTLYNYFADADAVVSFVESRVVEPITEAAEQIVGNGAAPGEQLADIAALFFDRVNEDRALAFALFSKRELSGPRAVHKLKIRTRIAGAVQRIVANGVASGQFRAVDATLFASFFLSAIGGLIETMFLSGEVQPAEKVVPIIMDVVLNGVRQTQTAPR